MAVGTAESRNHPSGAEHLARENDPSAQFIEDQLQKTGWRVKLTDLARDVMFLSACLLVAVFLLVLVDHWIVGLSFTARLVAFVGLVGATLLFVVIKLFLPLLGRVNPVYSAHLIEQSEPSLKNSLINLLFLRSDRTASREVVYRAMQQRAVQDLSRIELDGAVDRSSLIHVGYVLVGILTVCGFYTILSPKDPLQTIARVAVPWKRIARPSRVQITDVRPGDTRVYQGRSLEVSAVVRSGTVGSDVPVSLVYSTRDGRVVDREIPMKLPEGQLRFRCQLPGEDAGIEQDLVYQLQAGDAVTDPFNISVIPAPSIVVESIRYEYPAYTGRSPVVVPRQGDMMGLEGTRVTILARSNEDAKSAYVEFDAASAPNPSRIMGTPAAAKTTAPSQTIPMTVSGREFQVSFTLLLKPDRQTPRHSNYQLRFSTLDGAVNWQPVQYRIDVTPDLPPLVEILQPNEHEVEVPADSQTTIEVRAVDPDFALSSVSLRAESRGFSLFDEQLLGEPYAGQFTKRFDFIPRKLGLTKGDVAVVWAVAADNRVSSHGGQLAPNTETTRKYTLRVVAPRRRDQRDASHEPSDPSSRPGDQENVQNGPGQSTDRPNGQGNDADGQQKQTGNEPGQQQGSDQSTSGERADGNEENAQPADANSTGGQPGESSSPDGDSTRQENDRSGAQDDSQSHGQDARDTQPGATPSETGYGDGQTSGPNEDSREPLPSTGERDGDAFDRILKRMREQRGDESSDESQADDAQENPAGDASGVSDSPQTDDKGPRTEREQREKPPGANPRGDDSSEPDVNQQQRAGQGSEDADKSTRDENEAVGKAPNQSTDTGDQPAGTQRNGARTPDDQDGNSATDRPRPTGGQPDANEQNGGDDRVNHSAGNQTAEDQQGKGTADTQGQQPHGSKDGSSVTEARDGGKPTDRADGGQQSEGSGDGRQGESTDENRDGQPQDGADAQRNHTGQRPGQDAPSKTQPPSKENGSQSAGDQQRGDGQTDAQGEQTSAEPDSPGQDSAGQGDSQSTRPEQTRANDDQNNTRPPTGGGRQGASSGSDTSGDSGELKGDDPNLQYARKATDLALEYLKDQQDNPDRELLDRLGWTKDDVKRFIRRWELMKQGAAHQDEGGAQTRGELDNALRSLGLRPGQDRLRRGRSATDRMRGLRESGRRSSPPADYREQYEAFLKSTEHTTKD